jgi:phenylacetate-coenzyme A ligase PaaK-like adenylate-forming protein
MRAKIGVFIEANHDTLDTVPYLSHQDFAKQVRELSDYCDYVVVSLSSGGTGGPLSNGLNQYYTNPKALQKVI